MAEHDENESCGSCGRPLKDSRDFANLRTEKDALLTERDTLKTRLLERTIKDAGLDPSAEIVKMIAEKYDGDIGDPTAFGAHATALGFTPAAATNEPDRTNEQQLDALQDRSDSLRDITTPADTKTVREQIADAEARGDYAAARALKNQLLLDSAA